MDSMGQDGIAARVGKVPRDRKIRQTERAERTNRTGAQETLSSATRVCKPCSNFCTPTEGGTPLNYKTRAYFAILANFCAPLHPRHRKLANCHVPRGCPF